MELSIIILLIWIHFIADFVVQTRKMAENKSSDLSYLWQHSCVYGLCFLWVSVPFLVVTTLAHGIVDFITSKITKCFYQKKQWYQFFVVIGFDQAVHITLLILTYKWLA